MFIAYQYCYNISDGNSSKPLFRHFYLETLLKVLIKLVFCFVLSVNLQFFGQCCWSCNICIRFCFVIFFAPVKRLYFADIRLIQFCEFIVKYQVYHHTLPIKFAIVPAAGCDLGILLLFCILIIIFNLTIS